MNFMIIAAVSALLPTLQVGWQEVDINPEAPVLLRGQRHARLSEGIESPLKATALCLQNGPNAVALVSCDLAFAATALQNMVREKLNRPDLPLIFSASHTHTAPLVSLQPNDVGVPLPAQEAAAYTEFAAERISRAIVEAWNARKPGSFAFGVDDAVIGRNRRWVNDKGEATMYRLYKRVQDTFRHIEGYEDHNLNLLATYDETGKLTGLILNTAVPAQQNERAFQIGADFWHEVRAEIRKRHGNNLFILHQCSTAGDQSPHYIWGNEAYQRMLKLRNRTEREEIAIRVADATDRILSAIESEKNSDPVLQYRQIKVDLPAIKVSEEDLQEAKKTQAQLLEKYHKQLAELPPEGERPPRWYQPITSSYINSKMSQRVIDRYNNQNKPYPLVMNLLRLGDIAFATMPFEVYLDYGIQAKVRSPFIQTFLIQVSGNGSYLSSPRGEAGRGYGSRPSNSVVGSEGGQLMVEELVKGLRELKPVSAESKP